MMDLRRWAIFAPEGSSLASSTWYLACQRRHGEGLEEQLELAPPATRPWLFADTLCQVFGQHGPSIVVGGSVKQKLPQLWVVGFVCL
jgi:hypothetical protein